MMTIEIFKPFGQAFDLTKKILFQPFDLGKWCVIGFAAFLANLGGGGGFNFNYNSRATWREREVWHNFTGWLRQIPAPVLILGGAAIVFCLLVIIILFSWLRARGRFMFLDCIVKNRGAIKEPWLEFRKEGNSLFLLSLAVFFCSALVMTIVSLPFTVLMLRGGTFLHLHGVYLICTIVLWSLVMFALIMAWLVLQHFMIPVMYCRRCRAIDAVPVVWSLISDYPGEITLYFLFWIVLAVASGVVACLTTCVTCCLAVIPYVGTVILLPVFVCLRSFGLCYLRQFGPGYDVWATLPAPPTSPSPPTSEAPPLPS